MKKYALNLNGVYESVLEEILDAQGINPELVCYLQPYASEKIVKLAEEPPAPESAVTLYLSTTSSLSVVSYQAQVVGWENKQKLESNRFAQLNEHIAQHQLGEEGVYMTVGEGKACINLISIIQLERLPTPVPVTCFIKTSDHTPLKVRSTSGGWSYVNPLPDWVGKLTYSALDEELNIEHQSAVIDSSQLAEEERTKRLLKAPKLPESIQTISRGFKRNADVAATVLIRANGKCERCKSNAPFIRASNGTPYLEVHHEVMLSEGGEDTVENSIALCPNCHRELHFGTER